MVDEKKARYNKEDRENPLSLNAADKEVEPKPVKKKAPMRRRRGYMNRRASDRLGGSNATWLISFTDIMALMLTFFVLLFSMSEPKKEEWLKFTEKVQENFNRSQGAALNRGEQSGPTIGKVSYNRALNLTYLQTIIENLLKDDPVLTQVKIFHHGNNLIISMPQNLLFEPGKTEIKPLGEKALFSLAAAFSRIKNRLEIVGHTDPRAVSGGAFPSNWELSLTRAMTVAGILEAQGYRRDVTVRGHAAARYEDLPTSLPEKDRLDFSRRVDIVVMEDDGQRR